MPDYRITKDDFVTYIYLMHLIFPEDSTSKKILGIKNHISKHYVPTHHDNPSFRKTLDRNWNLIKAVRSGGKIKEDYLPKVSTVEIFISYTLGSGRKQSLKDFAKENTKEIETYAAQNPLSEIQMAQIFPALPEKIRCIEHRLDKIEEFIENYVQIIAERLLDNPDIQHSLSSKSFGEDKLTNEFIEYLRAECSDTKKQLKRAKYLYKNFGNLGLFFVPLKYVEISEESIVEGFFHSFEGIGREDIIDDLI